MGSLGEVRLAAVEHAQRRHHRVARAVRGRVVEAGLELLRHRTRLAQGLELLVERILQRLLLTPPPHLRLALGEHRRGLALDALALLRRRLQLLERQRAPARELLAAVLLRLQPLELPHVQRLRARTQRLPGVEDVGLQLVPVSHRRVWCRPTRC